MATEIASASQEQSRGCSEITKAMSQLDQMTQQNAATSEECASAAEELSSQADSLKNAIGRLVVTINGTDSKETFESNQSYAPSVKMESRAPEKKSGQAKGLAKVIRMKKPGKTVPGHDEAPLKKAVGDAPHYDDDGFKDV
jgi:methyl-accepting chemotaxis protein